MLYKGLIETGRGHYFVSVRSALDAKRFWTEVYHALEDRGLTPLFLKELVERYAHALHWYDAKLELQKEDWFENLKKLLQGAIEGGDTPFYLEKGEDDHAMRSRLVEYLNDGSATRKAAIAPKGLLSDEEKEKLLKNLEHYQNSNVFSLMFPLFMKSHSSVLLANPGFPAMRAAYDIVMEPYIEAKKPRGEAPRGDPGDTGCAILLMWIVRSHMMIRGTSDLSRVWRKKYEIDTFMDEKWNMARFRDGPASVRKHIRETQLSNPPPPPPQESRRISMAPAKQTLQSPMNTDAAQQNAHTLSYKVFTTLMDAKDPDDVHSGIGDAQYEMDEARFVEWLRKKGENGVLFGIFGLYLRERRQEGFLHAVAFTVRYADKEISGIQWYDSMEHKGRSWGDTRYPYADYESVWIEDAILVCEDPGLRQTLITSEPTTESVAASKTYAQVAATPTAQQLASSSPPAAAPRRSARIGRA